MTDLLQTLVSSLAIGSLYALIALGYTMVYGILKFINFAHSDIVVLGTWSSLVLAGLVSSALGLTAQQAAPWWVGGAVLIGAMGLSAGAGFVVERLAYKPLRRAPRLNVLITAIGVSLLLQNAGQLQYDLGGGLKLPFGTQPAGMPALLPDLELARLGGAGGEGGVVIGLVDVVIVATAALLMVLLELLVFRTRFGAAMRAVSFNTEHAALMGIRVNRVISITFMLGSALAAAAGFLFAMKYTQVQQPAHATWVLLGLKAFVAAVVGGIGNLRGAVLGGFLIALIELFGARYLDPDFKEVYVFVVLIVVLLARPAGILGRATREKV